MPLRFRRSWISSARRSSHLLCQPFTGAALQIPTLQQLAIPRGKRLHHKLHIQLRICIQRNMALHGSLAQFRRFVLQGEEFRLFFSVLAYRCFNVMTIYPAVCAGFSVETVSMCRIRQDQAVLHRSPASSRLPVRPQAVRYIKLL